MITTSHDLSRGVDIVVVGLGYVGLPLAQRASEVGLVVVGLDKDSRVVEGIRSGRSHVDDISDGDIQDMLDRGFQVTTDASVLALADAAIICVPTPLSPDGGPDLKAVVAATTDIAAHLHPGMLVILESTTYPGTTEEVLLPALSRAGGQVGKDFYLAFSPERIDPGNPTFGFRNTPKVVGGVTDVCTSIAAQLYGKMVDQVVEARGTREAEMAKLLENTYRHVNIALVNEMAMFCHDLNIDFWDVIDCASSKPFGFQRFTPGPGVGGHCIPIDPNYLSHNVRARLGYPFRFVELAQEINGGMPAYVRRRVQDLLNEEGKALKGSKVLLLGVTYKQDIADQRESPARPLAEILIEAGAEVAFHDPFVSHWQLSDRVLGTVEDLGAAVDAADLVVMLQTHNAYLGMDLDDLLRGAVVLDTRGVLDRELAERL